MQLSLSTRRNLVDLSVASILAFASASASAQVEKPKENMNESPYSFMTGVGVSNQARYLGSDRTKTRFIPLIEASAHTDWGLFTLGEKLQWSISPYPGGDIGLALGGGEGRKEKDDRRNLQGLGNIKSGTELNAFVIQRFGEFSVKTTATKGVSSGNRRFLIALEGSYERPISENLSFSVGAAMTWANRHYMQQFFGIDTTQAAHSGLSTHTAKAGLRDLSLSAGLRCKLTENWMALAQVSVLRLSNEVRNSPIVKQATQTQVMAGISYMW